MASEQPHGVYLAVVYHCEHIVEQHRHLRAHHLVVRHILLRQWTEVVFHMFFAYLVDTAEVIKHRHTAVVSEVEPGIDLNSRFVADTAQTESFFPTGTFLYCFLASQRVFHFSEGAHIIFDKSLGDCPIAFS